ncbi:hypothetical protein FHX37_3774 [Haloactinospora alba]|uniref:Hpr(Ser) kinase/phosphatase n=1 Tax=Haloactinospora alba TaxID=405555 RepID=A0A543N9F1_9ACTN|nr:hypothetical protein FHX37_3774 [Haloactinospora alba]
MRHTFRVDSAGRELVVVAPGQLAAWWPDMSSHVPGASADGMAHIADMRADLTVPSALGPHDTRRLINASLHRLHLRHDTLSVHATTLEHPSTGEAVLLLGGHGAGKSVTAMALTARGWRVISGDVTLLDTTPSNGPPRVRGGTRAFVVRRAPVRRWFPQLGVDADGPEKFDLAGCADFTDGSGSGEPRRVVAAAVVDVDGDPAASEGHRERVDSHTAATVWLRASAHLIDRVLERSDMVLRHVEDADAVRRRAGLVRALARTLPLSALRGSPSGVADQVERLAIPTS